MLVLELVLLLVVAGVGVAGASIALETVLAVANLRHQSGDAAQVMEAGHQGMMWYAAGIVMVVVARSITAFRKGSHIGTPFLLPASYAATALGLFIQYGYGNPFSTFWPGPEFARGVFLGSVIVSFILLVPLDLPGLLHRGRLALAALVVLLFGALAVFGQDPGHSGARINLGPIQPIEIVKVAAVLALSSYLGERASKLRYQRIKWLGLLFPRPRLLFPALVGLVATYAGLFFVHDLGPTLILGGVFLGLFYVATRSSGWVFLAISTMVVSLAVFGLYPDLAPAASVRLRLEMWTDPWYNSLRNGDQLVRAYWTLAAGGWSGTGIGSGWPGALPAGHTDLAFAHVVEELGLAGGAGYLLLLASAITDGLRVGSNNRTPERAMMATALGLLLASQAAVILGGTLGLFPLTGVVVPFLSYGKSGMAAFLGVVALIARLGEDANVRTDTDELKELRAGILGCQIAVVGAAVVLAAVTGYRAVFDRDEVTLKGAVTTLGDGTAKLLSDPRIVAVSAAIQRGPILDRNGTVLAESRDGTRRYPLGSALGTLLGPSESGLLRASWSVERIADTTLRGWPDRQDGPAVWLGAFPEGHERAVLAVPDASVEDPSEKGIAEKNYREMGGTGNLRRVALVAPDWRPLLPIVRLHLRERAAEAEKISLDLAPRTIKLTLDSRLQTALAEKVKAAASKSSVGAAAAVILDPSTGEILARVQWPDYDPADTQTWRDLRLKNDPRFMGIYGAWSDKTGLHGIFQAGSVFKLLSSVVAIRQGLVPPSEASCPTRSDPSFPCNQVSDGRTSFTLPGWSKPIHDHGDGGGRGTLDLVQALIQSSNVYFGQLALAMGSAPYKNLREAGIEFGNPGLLQETEGPWTGLGSGGSRRLAQTGFGQGAGSWSVLQSARLVAAIANGGTYYKCPGDMFFGKVCEKRKC